MLMVAKKDNKTATIYYQGVPAGGTCATLGTYGTTPLVLYVLLNS